MPISSPVEFRAKLEDALTPNSSNWSSPRSDLSYQYKAPETPATSPPSSRSSSPICTAPGDRYTPQEFQDDLDTYITDRILPQHNTVNPEMPHTLSSLSEQLSREAKIIMKEEKGKQDFPLHRWLGKQGGLGWEGFVVLQARAIMRGLPKGEVKCGKEGWTVEEWVTALKLRVEHDLAPLRAALLQVRGSRKRGD